MCSLGFPTSLLLGWQQRGRQQRKIHRRDEVQLPRTGVHTHLTVHAIDIPHANLLQPVTLHTHPIHVHVLFGEQVWCSNAAQHDALQPVQVYVHLQGRVHVHPLIQQGLTVQLHTAHANAGKSCTCLTSRPCEEERALPQ